MLNKDLLRGFEVNVDMKKINKRINTKAYFNTRDNKTAMLIFKLNMNNEPVNLENCKVLAKIKKSDNKTETAMAQVTDAKGGVIALGLDEQALCVVGEVELELIVQDDTQELYTPTFVFYVKDNLYDEDAGVESQTDYRVLRDLISNVTKVEVELKVLNDTITANEVKRDEAEGNRSEAEIERVESFNKIVVDFKNIKKLIDEKSALIDSKVVEADKAINDNIDKINATMDIKVKEIDSKITDVNLAKNNLTARVDAKILEVNSTKEGLIKTVDAKIKETNEAIVNINATKDTVINDIDALKVNVDLMVTNKLNEADVKIVAVNNATDKANAINDNINKAESLRVEAEKKREEKVANLVSELEITDSDITDIINMVGDI